MGLGRGSGTRWAQTPNATEATGNATRALDSWDSALHLSLFARKWT